MDPMTIMGLVGLLGGLGGAASGAASKGQGGSFWTGSKGGYDQVSRMTPQQQQMFGDMLQGLGGAQGSGMEWINDILSGDPEAFNKFEAPMKRQFEQETVPGIAERFAGLGSHGAQSSSAMQQTMGQAGRELTENLAALRGNLQQNALSQLQGLMGQAYQPTFESTYRQPTGGFLGGLGQGLAGGSGQLLGLAGLKGLGVS